MEQSSLRAPAPVNNEALAPTAVWRLMAPGGCLQPGQQGGTRAGAAGRPAAPSPAPTQSRPAGWDPSCRQMRTGAGTDSAPVSMRQLRCSGTAHGAERGQGPVRGGQPLFCTINGHFWLVAFPHPRWGWPGGTVSPAVSSLQGTSSTAWRQPATTPTRSRVCHRHRRTQPTRRATRSTVTPRAPSPAFPPATSTGRRR